MAHIMEFIINLLLLKGKFLKETAAETLHEAILKWLQFKRRLTFDYQKTSSMAGSFDNMWEMVNYHAGEYSTEENYVVNKNFHSRLRDQLKKIKRHEGLNYYDLWEPESKPHRYLKNECPAQICQRSAIFKKNGPDEKGDDITIRKKLKHQHYVEEKSLDKKKSHNMNDYLIDNLRAILKTQELLFKNITKLITILEKDHRVDNEKLENLKNKLNACTEILSGARPVFPENIINDIIEEEITRCRFRNGLASTSAEIDLRKRKPVGLEIIAEPGRFSKKAKLTTDEKQPETVEKKTEMSPKIKIDRANETLRRSVLQAEAAKDAKNFVDHYAKTKTIKIDHANETLRRSEIAAEVMRESKHFLDHYPKPLQIDRTNELLRHSQIELEVMNDAKKFANCFTETIRSSKSNEQLMRRSKIESNVVDDTKKFLDCFDKTWQIDRKNEIFSRENIDLEISKTSYFPRRSCSLPLIRTESISLSRKTSESDLEDSRKLIEINTQHFYQFENNLHHLKTTMKFQSLQKDHVNMRKVQFINKRQFIRIENSILRKMEQDRDRDDIEKLILANDIMFQIMERKLLFGKEELEKFEEELEREIKMMNLIDSETKLLHINNEAFQKLEQRNKEENELEESKRASSRARSDDRIITPGLSFPRNSKKEDVVKTGKQIKAMGEQEIKPKDDKLRKIIAHPEKKVKTITEIEKIRKIIDEPEQVSGSGLKKESPVPMGKVSAEKITEGKTVLAAPKLLQEIGKEKTTFQKDKTEEDTSQKFWKLKEVKNEVPPSPKKDEKLKSPAIFKPKEDKSLKPKETKDLARTEQPDCKKIEATEPVKTLQDNKQQKVAREPMIIKVKVDLNKIEKLSAGSEKKGEQNKNVMVQQEKKDKVAIAPEKQTQMMSLPEQKSTTSEAQKKTASTQEKTEKPPEISAETERKLAEVLSSVQTDTSKLQEDRNVTEHKVSELQRKNDAAVIQANEKAFDEMETTLKTLTIYMDQNNALSRSNSGYNPNADKNKRRVDDPSKKNMSTIIPWAQENATKPSSDSKLLSVKKEISVKSGYHREKSKTFLKSSSEITRKRLTSVSKPTKTLHGRGESKPKGVQITEVPGKEAHLKSHSLLQLRRTTKTAMKKQQVLTILPKVEREKQDIMKRKPKVAIIVPEEIKSVQTEPVPVKPCKDASTNTPRSRAKPRKSSKDKVAVTVKPRQVS